MLKTATGSVAEINDPKRKQCFIENPFLNMDIITIKKTLLEKNETNVPVILYINMVPKFL